MATIEHHERPAYLDRLAVLRDQVFALDHLFMSLFSTLGWIFRLALTIVLPAFVPEMRELAWRDVAVSGVTAQLGLSLIRFPVALALVAAGRHLPGIGPRSAANAAAESSAPSEAAS